MDLKILEVEMEKAELDKARAEVVKMWKEVFWYPVVMAAGLLGAGAAAAIAIIKILE
ncbi:hypothetical protein [Neisseria sp.]|uniref:hypothetical protein n=1 Tax=Neisseria sp. TaxID=192066 RepID=UPI0026DBCEB5|nr:hypothetical protein [Neisseria sp.]MDO4907629.1 hypothetical protein [Neisseria sp.]